MKNAKSGFFKWIHDKLLYGLSRKLVLQFSVITVIAPVVLAFLAIQNFQNANQGEIFNRLEGIAELKTSELIRFFENKKEFLETLAATPMLVMELEREEKDIASVREFIRVLQSADSDFHEIFFVDPKGEIVVSSEEEQEGKLVSRQAYFIEGKEGTYLSDVIFSIRHNEHSLNVSTPLRDEAGELFGVMVGQANLTRINDIMQENTGLKKTGETYLVNAVNFFVTEPRSQTGLALNKPLYTEAVERCLAGQNGSHIYENYDGKVVFGSYRWIPITELCLLAEIEQQEALGPFNVFRFFMGIIGVVVLVVVVGVGVYLARVLIGSIRELQKGAEEIGSGNLDYSFHIRTNDELEELAQGFDLMRRRLKITREKEQNLVKLKSEFITVVAHRLRTPLSGLKWALNMFADIEGGISSRQKDMIDKMSSSNERMVRLVNDLLDVAALDEGSFVQRRERISLVDAVKSALYALQWNSEKEKIKILFDEPNSPLPPVVADKDAIEVALHNIFENAIQYTPKGGEIQIKIELHANAVRVSVADNGIGIPKDEQQFIFSKFFRAANAMRQYTEGSGLGLYIVKNVLEKHGATIRFESEEGKGATFFIDFPINQQKMPKEGEDAASSADPSA